MKWAATSRRGSTWCTGFAARFPILSGPINYGNPDGMTAHYQLTAGCKSSTMVADLDYMFVGVSSAWHDLRSLATAQSRLSPKVRIVAVDAEGSVIFGGPAKKRYIPGIGASIEPQLLKYAQIDEVVPCAVRSKPCPGAGELLDRHGLFRGRVFWNGLPRHHLLPAAVAPQGQVRRR